MNWEAIGAVGEILGALAVVATLIYLSVQIRHSIQTTKGLVRDSASDRIVDDMRTSYIDKDVASAIIKLQKGQELSELESYCLGRHVRATLRVYENLYYQYRQGFFDREEWQGHRRVLMSVFAPYTENPENRFMAEKYSEWPDPYSVQFQELISDIRTQMADYEST